MPSVRSSLTSDTYDPNGNTTVGQVSDLTLRGNDVYDFENRLILRAKSDGSAINISYNGDGHRVGKNVLNASAQPVSSTTWLVDTNNLTGYAQVLEERISTPGGTTLRVYTYGTSLISQAISLNAQPSTLTYYSADGHGNIRELTDASGAVTERYDYDAFGLLVFRSGTTSSAYLYCGEQYDGDLGLYYLRARYLNPDSGRFWTLDSYEGAQGDPASLHKYLYAHANPMMFRDPSGHMGIAEAFGNLTMRVWITVNISHPNAAFIIGFAASLFIPAEVGIGLPRMGSIGRTSFSTAWAQAKELPALRRAYEEAKRSGNLPKLGEAGRNFEAWVIKVLGATKNTQSYKGGVPVPGNPAGARIPDVTMFKESILEVKSRGVNFAQAAEYARIARNEGRGITYIFEIMPSAGDIKKLRDTIAAIAPDVDVAINVLYLK